MKCRPQHGLSSSCFRWHVFRHKSHTSKARGSTPRCGRRLSGLCTRSTTAKDGMRAWTGRQSAPSCLCTSYKLTDLLYREARITDVTMKMLSKAAKTPEQSQCTCAVQTVGSVDGVSHRNTVRGRPSAGVFPHVFVSETVVCVTVETEYADSHYIP